MVSPHSTEEQEIWGTDVVVESIATCLAHLGKNYQWPADDNPMLVGAYSKKKDVRFFCTPNFLVSSKESCSC